jgi:hypothetical protein
MTSPDKKKRAARREIPGAAMTRTREEVSCRRCSRTVRFSMARWPRGWLQMTTGGWWCPKCKDLPYDKGGANHRAVVRALVRLAKTYERKAVAEREKARP